MEVKGLKEVKGVKQLLSKIITGNDFFDKVFTDAYDGNIFFESWNIFNFETYSLFLKLLIETNEKKAYLVPKNFLNY